MFDVNVNRIENSSLLRNKDYQKLKQDLGSYEPNAFYIGIVEDTNDPYKLGRIRVRVPGIHGTNDSQLYYLQTKSLPWAKPAILNSAGNDMGQFIVPAKGTRVLVSFEYNDLSKPLYFGGIPTLINNPKYYNDNKNINEGKTYEINTNDRITDLDKDSSQTVIYKSLKGATIIIDDKDGQESIKIIDAAGQQIIMGNDSTEPLPRRGSSTEPPSTAYIKIISGGTVIVECDEFNLECETTNICDDYCK